ncbi:hypothetical protein COLO4_23021 [Corchorus olitorius]|uniref:RING-CH-type domain-containing protein n=1 Tax=Corchorus olitorius TaxID=93759 RepID=A0A1R3IIN5_9ROSI|nr:hypothetical protein COLO4_23021 [Corchorus olitorius]
MAPPKKVKRYWPGKAPEWGDDGDADEDGDIRVAAPALEKACPAVDDSDVVRKDDRRLRRLAESRVDNIDELRADHRRIRQAEIVSTVEEEEEEENRRNEGMEAEEEDGDALKEERRRKSREKSLQRQQEETAAFLEEEEAEYETDSEEEENVGIPMVKTVYVPKSERDTISEREGLEAEERALEEAGKRKLERRKVETRQIVVDKIKEDEENEKNMELEANVDDDEVNKAEEYETWKLPKNLIRNRKAVTTEKTRVDREQQIRGRKPNKAVIVVQISIRRSEDYGENEEESLIQAVECRICQEEDSIQNLETPCACSGSLKYAHTKCVQHWCIEKGVVRYVIRLLLQDFELALLGLLFSLMAIFIWLPWLLADIFCLLTAVQPYQPGYTAPPCPPMQKKPLDIGRSLSLFEMLGTFPFNDLSICFVVEAGQSLAPLCICDPCLLAIAEAEHQFLEAQYDQYAASNAMSTFIPCSWTSIDFAWKYISHVLRVQLHKIEIMKDHIPLNARKERDAMDSDDIQEVQVIRSLVPDPLNQEPLLVLRIFQIHLLENIHGRQRQKWLRQIIIKSKRCLERELFLEALLSIRSELSSQFLAAWIIEDTDEEDSDAEDDEDDVGMVLDEGERGFPSQEGTKNPDFEDQASLYFRDSDEETENDSIMIVYCFASNTLLDAWHLRILLRCSEFDLPFLHTGSQEGENLTREQIKDEIKKVKEAHAEDEDVASMVTLPVLIFESMTLLKMAVLMPYWKMMHKCRCTDVASMVTLPVLIFEAMEC